MKILGHKPTLSAWFGLTGGALFLSVALVALAGMVICCWMPEKPKVLGVLMMPRRILWVGLTAWAVS